MERAHRAFGYLFVVVFLATGVYMRLTLPPPEQDDMGARMALRAIHVYILLSSLLNIMASARRGSQTLAANTTEKPWRRRARAFASVLLIMAPPVFTIAFFVEPAPGRRAKPISVVGAFAALIGTVLIERVRPRTP